MTILETRELTKYYGTGENQVRALDGVDLKVQAGEFLAIVGIQLLLQAQQLYDLADVRLVRAPSVQLNGQDDVLPHRQDGYQVVGPPGRWPQSLPSCWRTSPRETWTPGPARMS